MRKDDRILLGLAEHVDILALLLLVGDVEDLVLVVFVLCLFHHVLQGQILSVQVLKEDVVIHLLGELLISEASVLDEGRNVIPVLLIVLPVGLAHAGQLVRHLLGDVVGNLLDKSIILQRASGYVQRQIRAVDDALQKKQELRNDFLDVIGDKYLVVVQLDHALGALILQVDLREVEDTLQVKGIIHVQVNPEQRLLVVVEYLAVELLILLLGALAGCLVPEGIDIVQCHRTLQDLIGFLRRLHLHGFLCAVFLFLLLGLCRLYHGLDEGILLGQLILLDLLILGLGLGILKIDGQRHESAVFLDDLSGPVFIAEFGAVLIHVKGDLRADSILVAGIHPELGSSLGLPVNGLRILLPGQGIDGHSVRHHEGRIEAQTEMTDDLVLIGLVLILLQECLGAGKGDLVDVLLHLVHGHAETIILDDDGLLLGIDRYLHLIVGIGRLLVFAHQRQLLQLCDGVAAVGNQLSVENVVVGIKPLLDNGKYIFAVNR